MTNNRYFGQLAAAAVILLGDGCAGDVVIDHGLQRYHPYRASSTLLNVETLEIVRVGSCYPDIAYVLRRHFGIELP